MLFRVRHSYQSSFSSLTPCSESDRKYSDLENKNLDLRNAFKDKNKAFQDFQKQYIELKGEKMRYQARGAAPEVAEQVSQNATGGRFPSKSHAVRSKGVGGEFQGARGLYGRPPSVSSESTDGLRAQHTGASQIWQQTRQPSRGYTSRKFDNAPEIIQADQEQRACLCSRLLLHIAPVCRWP